MMTEIADEVEQCNPYLCFLCYLLLNVLLRELCVSVVNMNGIEGRWTCAFRHKPQTLDKIELQMTPMIDIVFQLNIFFLFTFKIILPEGDFNIRMPSAAAARATEISESLPMTLVMKAGPNGELAELRLNGRSFGNRPDAFAQLHEQIRGAVNDAGGPGTASDLEVEIDADYDLNYEYVMRAITASHRLYRKRRAARAGRADQIHAAEEERGAGSGERRSRYCSLRPDSDSLLLRHAPSSHARG